MKITLNTRVLVGHDHDRAAAFVRGYFPGAIAEIEWLQSPSAKCVLDLAPADPNSQFVLEKALRAHLELSCYVGDDPSGTEDFKAP